MHLGNILFVLLPLFVLPAACSSAIEAPSSEPTSSDALASKPKPDCRPKVFSKTIVSCCGLPAFYWDGKQCIDATNLRGKCGCICEGRDGKLWSPDCDAIFDSQDGCEAAYADCP